MKDKIALFDLDGTLAAYTEQLAKDLNNIKHPDEAIFHSENLDQNNEPDYVARRRRLITSQEEWWENLPAYQPGFAILNIAREIGFKIVVLTQGPYDKPEAWSGKIKWCKKHLPDVDSWTLTRNKSIVYGRVLVDDWPDYVTPWLDRRPRGIVIMPEHSWNKNYAHPRCVKSKSNPLSSYILTNEKEIRETLEKAYDRETPND